MKRITTYIGSLRHILLWSIAVLYLLFSPSLSYHLFSWEGKPLEVWKRQPEKTGGIRYNVEDLKYWSKNMASYQEGETYALWGWAFLDIDPKTLQADLDRFVVIYNDANAYVFPMQVYRRPGVQDTFKDLGLSDLTSSGFYAVISRNALTVGEYGISLLFKHKQDGTIHYIQTNKILVRSPNHLLIERKK